MLRKHVHKHLYSTVDAAAIRNTTAAVTTPSVHCVPKRLSAPFVDDSERLLGDDPVVTFRSNCVGSIFGVVDIWN